MFYSKLNKSSCSTPPQSEKAEYAFSGFSSVDASVVEIHTTHSSAPSKLASWKTYFERKTWHPLSPNMKWCNTSQIYSSKEGARSPISESSVAPSSSTALPTALSGCNTGSTVTHKKCVPTLPSVPSSSSPSSSPSDKKTASNAVNRSLSDMHAPTWLGLLMCNTVIRVSLFHPLQLALARKRVVQDGSPPSVFQWFKGAYRGGVKMLPGMKSSIDFGQGGTRGLYRGYGAALLSGWTSSIVYLFTMETLKEKFITASCSSEKNSSNGENGDAKGGETSQFRGHRWATAAGATCADALTLCVVTPIAVVVGRQMTSGVGLASDNPYRTVSGTFRHLWHLHQPRAEERLRRRPLSAGGIASKLWMWMYSGSGSSSFEKGLERSRDSASSTQGSHSSSRSTRPVTHPAHGGWLSAEKAPEGSTISSTSNAAHSKSRVSPSSKGAQPKSLRMPISTGAAAATTRVSSFSSVSAISGATPATSVTVGAAAQKKSIVSSLLSCIAPNSFLSPSSSSRSSPVTLWGRERFYPIRRHFWYTVYGARGLYQGLSVALCRIPFSGLWWASYTTAKESFYTIASPTLRHLQAAYPNVPGSYWIFSPSDNLLLNAFASASASVLTTLIVSPLSVLQVRLQALSSSTVTEAAGKSNATSKCAKKTVGTVFREKKVGETLTMRHRHIPRSGVKQMAIDIFRKEGVRGFYKGVSTNISIAILDGMVFSILFEVTRMLSDVNFGVKSTSDSSAPEVNS